jgi:hypothetical protein
MKSIIIFQEITIISPFEDIAKLSDRREGICNACAMSYW